MIFSKIFDKKFHNFEVSILLLENVREFSMVANLASKYDRSKPCSYPDMTFMVIFSKNFTKSIFFLNLNF